MANIGCRIYTEINRPAKEVIEKFRDMPVANIADCMGRISCVDKSIRPFNGTKLLGCAFTVKVPQGDNLMFHRALDMAKPGDVLVIDGGGSEDRSLCGEIMSRYAMAKKIQGFLIDGAIRDTYAIRELPFAVYAKAVQPNGPYKNGPGEINVPVSIGGITVMPGDIIVGDVDGVVVIKPEDAEELADKAQKLHEAERAVFNQIIAGQWNRVWVDEGLESLNCEIHKKAWTHN